MYQMKLHVPFGIFAITTLALSGCGAIERVAQGVADSARGGANPEATAASGAAASPAPTTSASAASKAPPSAATTATSKAPAVSSPPAVAKPAAAPAESAKPARDFIPMGGYDWEVVGKSEGNIKLQTKGAPADQIAIDAANTHCKKFGRLAQMSAPRKMVLFTWNFFSFNCVR